MSKKTTKQQPEKKIVTIKGVNEALYDQFTTLAKTRGKNIGTVFSYMISHFRKKGVMTKFTLPVLQTLKETAETKIEVIDNLEELTVTTRDLTSMPIDVTFHFKHIIHLLFDDSITTRIFLDRVYRITNCQVEFPATLPKLYALSKVRNYATKENSSSKTKNVTIRNVAAKAYNEFVAYCQMKNKLISEVVNNLLAQFVPEMEINQIIIGELQENPFDVLIISSMEELHLKNEDLKKVGEEKIVFHRINKLVFEESITNDLIISTVAGIYNCQETVFPPGISNLLSASKVRTYP